MMSAAATAAATATVEPITHVIFDIDGLLLDTERLYTRAADQILAAYGHQFSWQLKQQLMGRSQREAAAHIVHQLQLPITPGEYVRQSQLLWRQLFPEAQLMPGAERLVRHLYDHGVPIALASGMDADAYRLKTCRHGQLFSLFSHAVLASSDPDVARGKPAPDVFCVCADRFPVAPLRRHNVLVLEDAPNGVAAALAAGMQCVAVPDPRADGALLCGASQVLDSLEHFRPELFALPGYDD